MGEVHGLQVGAVDAISGYLQSKRSTNGPRIFMKLPEWAPGWFPGAVCEVFSSVYGLPESGFEFAIFVKNILLKIGYTEYENFPGLFYREIDGKKSFVGCYVDDLWLVGSSVADMVSELNANGLKVAEPELLKDGLKYNGVETIDDGTNIIDHMQRYTNLLIDDYKTQTAKQVLKIVDTPGLASLNVEKYLEPSALLGTADYDPHSLVASCLYLQRLSRPDISFAVSFLCRQIHCWSVGADMQLERLISYLESTNDLSIYNPKPTKPIVTGREMIEFLSDADLGGDLLSSRSSGGDVCYLSFEMTDGSRQRWIIAWSSKLLSQKATSTPWSECSAHHRALCDRALPLSLFLEDAQGFVCPVRGQCDNSPII